MPKLRPIRNDVLVHPFDKPSKIGSIHVPDQEQRRHRTNNGIVVSLGPLCSDDLSIGDHVLFNGYSGDKVTVENGIFFLVPESHVIGKVLDSKVKLMDSETVKRLISERLGEDLMKLDPQFGVNKVVRNILSQFSDSLYERLDSFIQSEGMEF